MHLPLLIFSNLFVLNNLHMFTKDSATSSPLLKMEVIGILDTTDLIAFLQNCCTGFIDGIFFRDHHHGITCVQSGGIIILNALWINTTVFEWCKIWMWILTMALSPNLLMARRNQMWLNSRSLQLSNRYSFFPFRHVSLPMLSSFFTKIKILFHG